MANTEAVRLALLLLGVVAIVAGCGSGTKTVTVERTVTRVKTVTTTPPTTATTTSTATTAAGACAGSELSGTFATVPGSAGAGQITYRLTVTNTSSGPCYVSGLPDVQLLGTTGSALPTHVSNARPGTATAARIVLQTGDAATAEARFSPDVPGPGEGSPGPCEPTATVLRVTAPGGGTADAPVQPPTAVCSHGALSFTLFTATS